MSVRSRSNRAAQTCPPSFPWMSWPVTRTRDPDNRRNHRVELTAEGTAAFHRLRQRYRLLLRDEIAQTVAVPGDVEDELRHFISVLQT